MMENENLRFQGLDWYSQENAEKILIGGSGGIGSWAALFLAKANFQIFLYDFDKIEEHNIGGQFFKKVQIEEYKVSATYSNIRDYCSNLINTFREPITEFTPTNEFVFSCFDNMVARKTLFEVWKKSWNSMNRPLLIDGRLNAEHFQIFCVTPETADKYEKEYLFEDSEVPDAPCSAQQTAHVAAMIASHMTGFFTNHISNIHLRDNIRELPFMYEYLVPMNLTEVIYV